VKILGYQIKETFSLMRYINNSFKPNTICSFFVINHISMRKQGEKKKERKKKKTKIKLQVSKTHKEQKEIVSSKLSFAPKK